MYKVERENYDLYVFNNESDLKEFANKNFITRSRFLDFDNLTEYNYFLTEV